MLTALPGQAARLRRAEASRSGSWHRAEFEDVREPAQEVAVQCLPALVEAVPAARIEDQLLRLPGALENVLAADIGQYLIGRAVDDKERPGTEGGDVLRAASLAAECRDGDDRPADRAGGDHHRAPEGVADEDDPVLALAGQPVQAQQNVLDAVPEAPGRR